MDQLEQYDIIAVGGGIGGSSLAAAMARRGARVLVLESETEFRDRVRGEWLAPWGAAEARRLGLDAAFGAAGAQPLPSLAGRSGKPRREATADGDVAITFSHPVLQEALLREAIDASVAVLRGARVRAVTGGSPARVTYELNGERHTAAARLVVGADGRSSIVRRALGIGAVTHRTGKWVTGVLLANVEVDADFGYFIVSDDARHVFSLFPQGGGRARAYVTGDGEDAGTFAGAAGIRRFVDALVAGGIPVASVASAQQAGPLASFRTDLSWVAHPVADGLALIGDAAGTSDPTWGMGLALALRDARALLDALARGPDWSAAGAAYAGERERYFSAVITAELWQNELLLTPGPEGQERRRRAQQAWREDPSRLLRLPGLGPDVDVSAEGRARFFGDDVLNQVAARSQSNTNTASSTDSSKEQNTMSAPATAQQQADAVNAAQQHSGAIVSAQPHPTVASESERQAIGHAFINALIERDFEALDSLLGPTMRMRSLLAHGHEDFHGSREVLRAFAGWFGGDFRTDILGTNVSIVGDRLAVSYHLRVHWPEPGPVEIEQAGYMKVQDGRIVTIDLLCSGWRPARVPLAMEAVAAGA